MQTMAVAVLPDRPPLIRNQRNELGNEKGDKDDAKGIFGKAWDPWNNFLNRI